METDALTKLQVERGIELDDKIDHLVERWAKVTDNARYLHFEHQYKEKEYGIKWRQVYKQELSNETKMLRSQFGAHLGDRKFADRNQEISAIVHKDFLDIRTFLKGKQFYLMVMMSENIDNYEISLNYLRFCLKARNLDELI